MKGSPIMNDFSSLEKTIVRELSCRLCLCTDVVKLKPLSTEVKRKLKKLFDIVVKTDDNLPKAICHDCLQQVSALHLYAVKVDKTQKFLDFYKTKSLEDKKETTPEQKMHPIVATTPTDVVADAEKKHSPLRPNRQDPKPKSIEKVPKPIENQHQQGDVKSPKQKVIPSVAPKKKTPADMKFMESMPLDEFVKAEKLDKSLLNSTKSIVQTIESKDRHHNKHRVENVYRVETDRDCLDTTVLIDGRPAKTGAELDKQITLFYKMECCICHENGFHFRSLMRHYKDRHGVPGYVTCCDKKFHYFYPKKIIEHMAFHLQPHIFRCPSCHSNFETSQELHEHQSNGGRSEGRILCPRCEERYPTYHELGRHLLTHRVGKERQCDYCGKPLKHNHRKKTINHMENIILCSQCVRTLKSIEKQEKEIREKAKASKTSDHARPKSNKFKQAMGFSEDDDDESTD